MESGKVTGVSRTAIGVAFLRAMETNRPDALFSDPHAEAFVTAAMSSIAEDPAVAAGQLEKALKLFGLHIVLRTRFYDDYLLAATAAGCRQVVLLAAGLDTRAVRLPWPDGTAVYELDLPELLDYKEKVLADRGAKPACRRTVLPVDLREDWTSPLVGAGLDPRRPTAWLIEGLLDYLSAEHAAGLLTAVGGISAAGSRLACEHRDDTVLEDRARAEQDLAEVTALWLGGLGRRLPAWLEQHGWRTETHDGAALARTYGRSEPDAVHIGFLTAVRGERPGDTS